MWYQAIKNRLFIVVIVGVFLVFLGSRGAYAAAGAASTGGLPAKAGQQAAKKAGEQAAKKAQDAGKGADTTGSAADAATRAAGAAADTAGAAAQAAGATAMTGAAATAGTAAIAGAAATAGAAAVKGAAAVIGAAKKAGEDAAQKALPERKERALYEGMELPSTVAVLPATGEGAEEDLKEIRISMANHLGYKNYQDLEIAEIESKLFMASKTEGKNWTDFSPQELGEILNTDGLFYTEVLGIDKIYVGVYASLTVRVSTKLVDAKTGDVIWVKEDATSKKAGGVPTSIFSAITTAISSSLVLKESVKITLVDQLCRKIVRDMPEPESLGVIKPPPIFSVITNGLDGPFKANDEILVSMQGEKGFHSYFIIGKGREAVPMTEVEPETYMGKYIVKEGDNWTNELLYVFLANTSQRVESKYLSSHTVTVDTIPPKGVENAASTIVKEGISLTWQPPLDEDDLKDYSIHRASVDSEEFMEIGTTPVPEFIDKDVAFGKKFYYRIYSRDRARNLGKPQEIIQMAVKQGPTIISGELSTQTFFMIGSPYIINGSATLPVSARLDIEGGAIIQFNENSSLNIQGKVNAAGTQESNITVKGNNYRIEFVDVGEPGGVWKNTYFSGGDVIKVSNSSVTFENSIFEGFGTGIELGRGSKAVVHNSTFRKNQTGINISDSRLNLDNIEFAENEKALIVNNGSEITAGTLKSVKDNTSVETTIPFEIAMMEFDESSWPAIINRISGDVSIQSIQPVGLSLLKLKEGLLEKLRSDLSDELIKSDFLAAKKVSDDIGSFFPDDFDKMADVMAYVYTFGGDPDKAAKILSEGKIKNRKILTQVLNAGEKEKGDVSVGFISIKVPMLNSVADAEKTAAKKAQINAVRNFVDIHCGDKISPQDKREFIGKAPDRLDSFVLLSAPVFQKEQGGIYGGTYMIFLNTDAVIEDLSTLMVASLKDSNVRLGIVDCTGVSIFESVIKDNLTKINFKYEYLGSGSCDPASYYKIAGEREIDALLMIGADFSISIGKLSKVIKKIDGTLKLNAYKVDTKHSVLNLTKSVTVTHVNEETGKKFALKSAFESLERNFDRELVEIAKSCSTDKETSN